MKAINLENDNQIDTSNLQVEFREFPSTLFAWGEAGADAALDYELSNSVYEETRASLYLKIKSSGDKVTEKHLEALIDTDPSVKEALLKSFAAKRDLDTMKNYVESLRAKKDMLIQLGADARKE